MSSIFLEIPESTVYGKLSNLHQQTPRIENRNRKPRWGGTRETKGGKQAEAPIQDDTSSDPKQNASTSNYCDAQSKHQARLLFQIATGGEIDFWAFAAHEGASKNRIQIGEQVSRNQGERQDPQE